MVPESQFPLSVITIFMEGRSFREIYGIGKSVPHFCHYHVRVVFCSGVKSVPPFCHNSKVARLLGKNWEVARKVACLLGKIYGF